jgi:hypothetical protein
VRLDTRRVPEVLERRSAMSLRAFHLFFILIAIVGADLFAIWSLVNYNKSQDVVVLGLGITSLVVGVGLIFYGVMVTRKFDLLHSR